MNGDIAKLFFDTFSGRIASLESSFQRLSSELERLKASDDQSKLSALVLLERLQKTDKILVESLNWIKQVADTVFRVPIPAAAETTVAEAASEQPKSGLGPDMERIAAYPQIHHDPSIVQPGSLNSITTPTELQVLTLLANEGPKSAPEIGKFVGRSREHTARLMKKLFDEGYVRRDQTRIPFRYSTVERLKGGFTRPILKDQGLEVASAPAP